MQELIMQFSIIVMVEKGLICVYLCMLVNEGEAFNCLFSTCPCDAFKYLSTEQQNNMYVA